MQVAGGDADKLIKGARELAPDNAGVSTKVLVTAPAAIAATATHHWIDDDVLTFLQTLHIRARARDGAGRLVPKHERIMHARVVAQEHGEIGVTNRGSGNADDHVAR